MTDKESTIKELKEALDSLDITNKYRLNIIRAIEYLQEKPVIEDILDMSRIDYKLQHESIQDGIKYHAEEYSFNIESALYNQLTSEQQKLWHKDIEDAVISGGYCGLELSKDKRYKEHLWKPADGDDLPEIGREVVAFQEIFPTKVDAPSLFKIVMVHRPNPKGYDGKSISTGEIEHYTPKTYDKGGWNIPDVKWWLDVELPKEIEL